MILSLIGMSNSGKSFWSGQLQERGFMRFDCDERIASQWEGKPFCEHEAAAEEQYLALEARVMRDILAEVATCPGSRAVIDCTGSVIYLEASLRAMLKQRSVVVLLETPKNILQAMIERYKQFPKPLIWAAQTDYAALLDWRNIQYRALADRVILYEHHRDPAFTVVQFLYEVLQHK